MAFERVKKLNLILGEENCDTENFFILMWQYGCWAAQPFFAKITECTNVVIEPRSLDPLGD